MSTAIEIQNLSKSFGSKHAVRNVSFTVEQGEIFGFLGPNGAGKSTTIRMLMNFISPSNGHISALGFDAQNDYSELHKNLGYLSGDMELYGDLSGRQYIAYMTNLYGKATKSRIAELAKKLNADLKPRIKTLSRGNRQKIGLIAAMAHQPKLLILDEPTSGLDPLIQEVFYDLLADHQAAGGTTFMSSHNLTEVQRVCDRVAFIRDGKLVEVSKVKDLRSASVQEFVVEFAAPVPKSEFSKLASLSNVSVKDSQLTCTVHGHLTELIKALAKHDVVSIDARELELEEVFLKLYGKGSHV